MASQLEFQGMGMQIVLLLKVRLIVSAFVVIDQRDRYDEGKGALTIKVDNLEQFLLFIPRELFLEITQDMRENVSIFLGRGFQAKGFHQKFLVFLIEPFQRDTFGLGHQFLHHPVMPGAVGEDQHLVLGMKFHQNTPALLSPKGLSPPFKDKDTFYEIFTEF
jgi:hypothetical protein